MACDYKCKLNTDKSPSTSPHNLVLMTGTLIFGANQLKEQKRLYMSGSDDLSEGKKKKKGLFLLEAALKNVGL